MKKVNFILGVFLLFAACTTTDLKQDALDAEAAIKGFYAAVEEFDYEAMATFCTSDFSAYEEGFPFSDLEGFVGILKSFEGAEGNVNMNFVKTEIMGDMAFSVVEFDALWTIGAVKMAFKTYENYILKKVDGKWLMHYFHSTHLPDPNDKGYTSVHLMKIPEELPVKVLEDALGKYNEAIASIGYGDCGYKMLKVDPGSNDDYNYVMKGKWKNKEIYDIIHEHESFKNVSNETPETLKDYFKDQVYLKVSL